MAFDIRPAALIHFSHPPYCILVVSQLIAVFYHIQLKILRCHDAYMQRIFAALQHSLPASAQYNHIALIGHLHLHLCGQLRVHLFIHGYQCLIPVVGQLGHSRRCPPLVFRQPRQGICVSRREKFSQNSQCGMFG